METLYGINVFSFEESIQYSITLLMGGYNFQAILIPAIHAQQYNTPKLILLALVQCSQVSAKAQAHAFVNVSVVCEAHEISSAPIKYQPFSAPRKSSTSSRTPQHAVI